MIPSNQNSPILGCIFDSVFNDPKTDNTVLTLMMGGEWFDEYIGNKSESEIFSLAFNELKKHLKLDRNPNLYEVSILKVNKIFLFKQKFENFLTFFFSFSI